MSQSNPDTTDYDPYNIKNGRQTTRIAWNVPYLSAKWEQSQETNFKTLNAKWNTNNGEAKHKSGNHILKEN